MENEKVSEDKAAHEDTGAPRGAYLRAKAIVGARFSFYIHLAVYLGVNLLLVFINLFTSPSYLWCLWPIAGWGVGLFFHALVTFSLSGMLGFKDRMYKDELERQLKK